MTENMNGAKRVSKIKKDSFLGPVYCLPIKDARYIFKLAMKAEEWKEKGADLDEMKCALVGSQWRENMIATVKELKEENKELKECLKKI